MGEAGVRAPRERDAAHAAGGGGLHQAERRRRPRRPRPGHAGEPVAEPARRVERCVERGEACAQRRRGEVRRSGGRSGGGPPESTCRKPKSSAGSVLGSPSVALGDGLGSWSCDGTPSEARGGEGASSAASQLLESCTAPPCSARGVRIEVSGVSSGPSAGAHTLSPPARASLPKRERGGATSPTCCEAPAASALDDSETRSRERRLLRAGAERWRTWRRRRRGRRRAAAAAATRPS